MYQQRSSKSVSWSLSSSSSSSSSSWVSLPLLVSLSIVHNVITKTVHVSVLGMKLVVPVLLLLFVVLLEHQPNYNHFIVSATDATTGTSSRNAVTSASIDDTDSAIPMTTTATTSSSSSTTEFNDGIMFHVSTNDIIDMAMARPIQDDQQAEPQNIIMPTHNLRGTSTAGTTVGTSTVDTATDTIATIPVEHSTSSSIMINEQEPTIVYPKIKATSIRHYLDLVNKFVPKQLVLLQWNANGELMNVSSNIQCMEKEGWLALHKKDTKLYTLFSQTSSSLFGKVAFVYNHDVADGYGWSVFDIEPPIPIMFYTIPKSIITVSTSSEPVVETETETETEPEHEYEYEEEHRIHPLVQTNTNFYLVPNPYDRNGGSSYTIDKIRRHLRHLSSTSRVVADADTNADADEPIITYDEFMNRKEMIVWRGEIHPGGDSSTSSRKRIMELFQKQGMVDDNNNNNNEQQQQHQQQWLDVADTGSGQNRIPAEIMSSHYRYQIDIGGISGTSWDGLRWKMCSSGSLVFRVQTDTMDWWHSTIVPWKHYIPVRKDLNDLYDLFMWVHYNPEIAYNISVAGQKACLQTSTTLYAEEEQQHIIYTLPDATYDIAIETDTIFDEHYLENLYI